VWIEALKQAPGRQGAAGQVGKATLGQFVQGNDAEELLSEQRHLWQCLFADVLRQGRLQLMLEVGLAGCGEERHLWYSAWALLLMEASRIPRGTVSSVRRVVSPGNESK
jgi:hypothetical protein